MREPFERRLALLLFVSLLAACGGSSSPAGPTPSSYVIPAADLADMLAEKVMGNASAPVTMYEYSSLTCPHCSTFHLGTFPQVKAAYIDTGKVKFVYRDFPVPGASTSEVAYAGAAVARCAGSARYFEALDLLYRAQGTWVSTSTPLAALKQAMAPLGLPSEKMDACMSSVEIRNEITRVAADARAAYGVGGTPTVVINGQKVEASFTGIDAVLRELTAR